MVPEDAFGAGCPVILVTHDNSNTALFDNRRTVRM